MAFIIGRNTTTVTTPLKYSEDEIPENPSFVPVAWLSVGIFAAAAAMVVVWNTAVPDNWEHTKRVARDVKHLPHQTVCTIPVPWMKSFFSCKPS